METSNIVISTGGVDLAAEPRKTALAVLEWRGARAALTDLRLGVSDAEIAEVAPGPDSLGIDCAFGWPDDFVKFVADHAHGERVDRIIDEGSAWRKRLSYRQTDRAVFAATGRWPLSVATNLLGLTAMHCAALLDLLGETLGPIDRSGGGRVAEVYPGAMLRLWGFDTVGYK